MNYPNRGYEGPGSLAICNPPIIAAEKTQVVRYSRALEMFRGWWRFLPTSIQLGTASKYARWTCCYAEVHCPQLPADPIAQMGGRDGPEG